MNSILDSNFVKTIFGNRLHAPLASTPVAAPTPRTGAGLPAVWKPPTVEAPPNASAAVLAQIGSSTQLEENTDTGAGTGAGRTSFPITTIRPGWHNYGILAALGIALLVAWAWDEGRL